jgi:hypothetical protein
VPTRWFREYVAAVLLLAALGVSACSSGKADFGPLVLSSDDRLVAEDQADGRIWRVYNDCPMARNTTWTSDDGKSWRRHDGPGFINCTNGSGVRIDAVSRQEATAEVVLGAAQVRQLWRTTDGGQTWKLTSTDETG